MSVRSQADMRLLGPSSFKHSNNTYWVSSRQSPNLLWGEPLSPSDPAVIRFYDRPADGHPHPFLNDFGNTFDHWIGCWRSGTFEPDTRGDKNKAGAAHPTKESGAQSRPLARVHRMHVALHSMRQQNNALSISLSPPPLQRYSLRHGSGPGQLLRGKGSWRLARRTTRT